MENHSWKIVFGTLSGAALVGLILVNSPRIQAAAVGVAESQVAQVFQRKVYTATLSSTNGSGVSGTARLVLDGEHLGVDLEAFGLNPTIPHPQFLRSGTACPTPADDTNQDGFVDAIEATVPSGPPILPLTLSGQPLQVTEASATPLPSGSPSPSASASPSASPSATVGILEQDFPLPAEDGHLTYIQAFSTSVVSAAFPPKATASPSASPSASSSPSPSATPASAISGIDLTNRVIMIHGFAPGTFLQLPSTLGTILGLPAEASLPVACGVLVQETE